MKNFTKVQKKGILSTRTLDNNRLHNSSQNFEQIVQKQLQDDFKVHQYLNENPNEGHNTQQYTSLLNLLAVRKMKKIKQKQLLQISKTHIQQRHKSNNQSTFRSIKNISVKSQSQDNYYSEQEYLAIKKQSEAQQQLIQIKTQQQLQMRRVLLKQISQNKKSLNLLKGDIGHMIARNQSISVLQSKVNKVSLVSENQLKRVSLALSKDKQEVLLRQQMQKKFSLKLKSIEILQNKNLKKIKSSYLQSMNRRRQIFENLHQIQKQCASIQQYSDKQKQKEEKNFKTINEFTLLNFVCKVIQQSKKSWQAFQEQKNKSQSFSQKLNAIFDHNLDFSSQIFAQQNFQIDDVTQERLNCFEQIIKIQYERLVNSILQKKKQYNQKIQKIQQSLFKIGRFYGQKTTVLCQFNKQQKIQLIQRSKQSFVYGKYLKIFSYLKRNNRILCLFIDFLNKNIKNFDDKVLINKIYKNQCFHIKVQCAQNQNSQYDELIFDEIKGKIKCWLEKLLNQILYYQNLSDETKQQIDKACLRNQQKNRKQMQLIQQLSARETLNQFGFSQNNISESETSKFDQIYQLNTDKDSINETKASQTQSKKKTQNETAKRIQILQKIDQSYYRMIKQTIEMQKQNTMKNYQFQKSFKRNKYSSQDQLLQEKRFEATFSNLFKQDPDFIQGRSKSRQESLRISRIINKQKKSIKSTFASLHTRSKVNFSTKSTNLQVVKKNATFWQNQNKIRLRNKLKNILGSF